MNKDAPVVLTLPLRRNFLDLLLRFVEEGAKALGLDEKGSLRLVLATEEICAFLLDQAMREELSLAISDGGADVEVRLTLPDGALPLEAFNLVAEEGMGLSTSRHGLFIAARIVSSLRAFRDGRQLILSFSQDRAYGATRPMGEGPSKEGPWRVKAAGAAEALQLAARAASCPAGDVPSFVLQDGKAVDLMASGRWGAFVAVDGRDSVGAGLFWERRGRTAFLHGPWLFAPSPDLVGLVLDFALGELARQDLAGVSLLSSEAGTPLERFEVLGRLPLGEGEATAYYCLLGEDDGGPLYVHPSLEPFVAAKVDALCLPRTVHAVGSGRLPPRSALAIGTDLASKEASLSVLAPGQDGAENLRAHLKALSEQGIEKVTFSLDLGSPDEASMGGSLVEAGFEPRVLLPWAGRGDLLLLVPSRGASSS